MKYIKLFESFDDKQHTDLFDLIEQIKGVFYEIEDNGLVCKYEGQKWDSYLHPDKKVEEINITIESITPNNKFKLTNDIIDIIKTFLNWMTKEHGFRNNIKIIVYSHSLLKHYKFLDDSHLIESEFDLDGFRNLYILGIVFKSQRKV